MGQWVRAQGQLKVAKNLKTCPHCDVPSRKSQTENEKRFFGLNQKTCWIHREFEQLSSSSGWRFLAKKRAGKLRPLKG